jgi:uncharacterized metal-binding protein (TIGR02443 family)
MTAPKRFIAGAVCPDCQQVDKLVVYEQGNSKYRECVRCGYRQLMNGDGGVEELATRVNKVTSPTNDKSVGEEEVDVVRIVGDSTVKTCLLEDGLIARRNN